MTDDYVVLSRRQDRTEGRVLVLEDDARIRARAFADMDRDVSDLRVQYGVQRQMLQAVADTLSDHTSRLTRLETKFDGLEMKVDDHTRRLDRLETKVDGLDVRVGRLETDMTEVKTSLGVVRTGIDTIIEKLDKAS